MNKASIKRISIVGLILIITSTVTAALLPEKSEDTPDDYPGSLTQSTDSYGGQLTCTVSAGLADQQCNVTAGTLTTTYPALDSYDEDWCNTERNTTL